MATMRLALTEEQRALRKGVGEICERYPGEYWRELDARREYPEAFVTDLLTSCLDKLSMQRRTHVPDDG
jgi:hypothetical protein